MRLKLIARAEVVRRLRIEDTFLEVLETEEIVVTQRGRFRAADLDRIRVAAELHALGVNPAGIDVFLRMRERWQREREELTDLMGRLHARLRGPQPRRSGH